VREGPVSAAQPTFEGRLGSTGQGLLVAETGGATSCVTPALSVSVSSTLCPDVIQGWRFAASKTNAEFLGD
jgi:hypothetical protein